MKDLHVAKFAKNIGFSQVILHTRKFLATSATPNLATFAFNQAEVQYKKLPGA